MIFRDMGWVIEEYQFNIVIGYVAYSITVAFLESLIVFPAVIVLSLFMPPRWEKQTSFALTGTLATVISLWAISNQIYFLFLKSPTSWFTWVQLRVYYHQPFGFSVLLSLILVSVVLPIYLIEKKPTVRNAVLVVIDRLGLLSIFYLVVDSISIIYMIFRLSG